MGRAGEQSGGLQRGAGLEATARVRLERQRAAFDALPAGEARNCLRDMMLARAEELLSVNPEAADALLEFLPEADRDKLLADFFEKS